MKSSRGFALWLLIVLQLLLGIGATISGVMLILKPDGSLLQLPLDLLLGSPFSDYLIPGILLFVFIGLFPLFTAFSLLKRPQWKKLNAINPFKEFHWAWVASIAAGIILLIWVLTETALVGYVSFLQPVMGGWGLLLILLSLMPVVKQQYKVK